MSIPERRLEERTCNCKNSKCVKLYCQCFAARISCNKNCRCLDCQNTQEKQLARQSAIAEKKLHREDFLTTSKGCACRRSNCMKRYCQCFQSGIRCRESCKCIDCHNNDSLLNSKVVEQLRKQRNDIDADNNNVNLYPLKLSQNSQQFNNMIASSNPLKLQEKWLSNSAKMLYESSQQQNPSSVMNKLIQILSELEQNISEQILQKNYMEINQLQSQNVRQSTPQANPIIKLITNQEQQMQENMGEKQVNLVQQQKMEQQISKKIDNVQEKQMQNQSQQKLN